MNTKRYKYIPVVHPTPEGAPAPGSEVAVAGRSAVVDGIPIWIEGIRRAVVDHYDAKGAAVVRPVPFDGYRSARVGDLHPSGSWVRIRDPHDTEVPMAKPKKPRKEKSPKAPRRPAGAPKPAAEKRAAAKGDRTVFLVEKGGAGGVFVAIQGQEEKTKELIPAKVLEASVMKAAYAYTEKHIGPREQVGNKGGSLYNRIRAVLGVWTPPARKAS